jgi:CRISPR-associated protein Csm3
LERVPAGAKFSVRMILDVLCEEDKALAAALAQALRMLEDDTLGGGGSRGSGRVKINSLKVTWRGKSYYSAGEAEQVLVEGAGAAELQKAVAAEDFAGKLS